MVPEETINMASSTKADEAVVETQPGASLLPYDQQPNANLLPYDQVALGDTEDDDEIGSSSLATACMYLCLPPTLLCSWVAVQQRTEAVVLHYGTYTGTVKEPGCHFINCCGRELRMISTAAQSIDLPQTKILDKNGNPLLVSAIIVYHVVNTKRAAIDVQNAYQFVSLQATAVLKQIVSQYPYESPKGEEHETSLKTEAVEIGHRLRSTLQGKIAQAGCVCQSFQLNEISFAPEIAANMLKRQAAEALVQARELIVQGAIGISLTAVQELEKGGLKLTPEQQANLVSSLLVVTCGDQDAQPVLNV